MEEYKDSTTDGLLSKIDGCINFLNLYDFDIPFAINEFVINGPKHESIDDEDEEWDTGEWLQ